MRTDPHHIVAARWSDLMSFHHLRLTTAQGSIIRLAGNAIAILILSSHFSSAQTTMDELAGTREKLSMTCATMAILGMPPNDSQSGRVINQYLLNVLNENLSLARRGESNPQFLMRFLDFHTTRAGFVVGQRQSELVMKGVYRASFLLSQISSSGDSSSLRHIAEACVNTFRSEQ